MLHPQTLQFLSYLKDNNDKKSFELVRPLYENVWHELIQRTHQLIKHISEFDDELNPDIDPKKCLFRIYRDARFAKGIPYKTNWWMVIWPDGKRSTWSRYYVHLQPWESFFAWGMYNPNAKELYNLRTYLSAHHKEYFKLIQKKQFKDRFGEVQWDKAARIPKGFEDSPAPELITQKQFLIYHKYSDKEVLSDAFMDEVLIDCKIAKDRFKFINDGVRQV